MHPRFICEPLVIPGDLRAFIEREVGICIPLASVEAYRDTDAVTLDSISRYLVDHRPFFTVAYYTDSNLSRPRSRVEPLPVHRREWKTHVNRLIGEENTCFVSNWNLLPQDLSTLLPQGYSGRVVPRGSTGKIPVLVEWTQDLVDGTAPSGRHDGFSNIWNFGTWGYILPKQAVPKLQTWAQLTHVNRRQVAEFFRTVRLTFWVKLELDGIVVMSHLWDADRIRAFVDAV